MPIPQSAPHLTRVVLEQAAAHGMVVAHLSFSVTNTSIMFENDPTENEARLFLGDIGVEVAGTRSHPSRDGTTSWTLRGRYEDREVLVWIEAPKSAETALVWQPANGPKQTLYGDFDPEEISAIVALAEIDDTECHTLSIPLRTTPDGPTYGRLIQASRIIAVGDRLIDRRQ